MLLCKTAVGSCTAAAGGKKKVPTPLLVLSSVHLVKAAERFRRWGWPASPAELAGCRWGAEGPPPPASLLVLRLLGQQRAAHHAAPSGRRGAAGRSPHLQQGWVRERDGTGPGRAACPEPCPPPRARAAAASPRAWRCRCPAGPRSCRPPPFCSRGGCCAASPSPGQPAGAAPSPAPLPAFLSPPPRAVALGESLLAPLGPGGGGSARRGTLGALLQARAATFRPRLGRPFPHTHRVRSPLTQPAAWGGPAPRAEDRDQAAHSIAGLPRVWVREKWWGLRWLYTRHCTK